MKKISVIVPVFNGEKYISKCIESIIKQTYKNLEIIIINDGSTDNTQAIIEKIAQEDDRIKIVQKKNEGVSVARNTGIKVATGEYIGFIDSDDWIEKDWFELLIKRLEETSCDVIRGNYIRVDTNGKVLLHGNIEDLRNTKIQKKDFIKIQKYIINGKIQAYTPLLVIKSNIVKDKIFFCEKIHFMEDTNFYIDLINNIESIYFLDLEGYNYFSNPTSAVKNIDFIGRNIDNIKKVNKIMREKIDSSLYSEMALIELDMVVNYIFILYKYKMITLKEARQMIQEKDFENMINDINSADLSRNKVINAIKQRKYFFVDIYFCTRKIVSILKDLIIGER